MNKPAAEGKGQTRILLVDDHDIVRRGLRSLVERHENWVVCGEAANGREAVELALAERPDVVVIDVAMPEMNGLEATRAITERLPGTEVLIFAPSDSDTYFLDAVQAGARGYLLKSDPARLIPAAIDALSDHKPYFSWKVSRVLAERYLRAPGPLIGNVLTTRQRTVLQLIAEGKSNKDIASSLGISVKTVETHRAAIMRKLGLGSVAQLVRYAVRNRLIDP
jgi:DNA-binding NarL/FixJ family response regulator